MTRDLRYVGVAPAEAEVWWVVFTLKPSGLRVAFELVGERDLKGSWFWSERGPEEASRERPEGVAYWVRRMPDQGRKRGAEEREAFVDAVKVLWAAGMGRKSIARALGVSIRPVQWISRGTGERVLRGRQKSGKTQWDFVRSGVTREEAWDQMKGRFGL